MGLPPPCPGSRGDSVLAGGMQPPIEPIEQPPSPSIAAIAFGLGRVCAHALTHARSLRIRNSGFVLVDGVRLPVGSCRVVLREGNGPRTRICPVGSIAYPMDGSRGGNIPVQVHATATPKVAFSSSRVLKIYSSTRHTEMVLPCEAC